MKLNITKEDKSMSFRVALITKLGTTYSLNAETRQEIDEYLLSMDEKEGLKLYRIIDKQTGELIETQDGVRNKGDNQ